MYSSKSNICCFFYFDHSQMQEIGKFTRIGVPDRIARLIEFNRRLQNTPESMKKFAGWGLELDKSLVEVAGRVLPSEKIQFGRNKM